MSAETVRALLQPHTGALRRLTPVGGGCIAHACRVEAARGPFFLKYSEEAAGDTFVAEAAGLCALREAASGTGVKVPRVLHVQNRGAGPGVLLLEWISAGAPGPGYWERFGEALAQLHRPRAAATVRYGFDSDNYIGQLPQENGWHEAWPAFFRERRLLPQIARARAAGHWRGEWEGRADRLLGRLEELLPRTPEPSCVHGDLWSGNQVADVDGTAWLVDPATYVGHREVDLAMTELFGGFPQAFAAAYRSAWELEPGYEERREVYNLYHLVNHLNHFGASYAGGVERTLRHFSDGRGVVSVPPRLRDG